jgi:hypothetical protein
MFLRLVVLVEAMVARHRPFFARQEGFRVLVLRVLSSNKGTTVSTVR